MEYKCHVCGGLCDSGELESGVCFDCRREAVERREKRELDTRKLWNRKMLARNMAEQNTMEQPDGQMVLIC